MKYCAIIPTYNHAATLVDVVSKVLREIPNVIVVNDGSTDNTLEELQKVGSATIISYPKNRGKGYALKTGFKKAVELGFDYAVTIDSDGQHNPSEIAGFIALEQKCPGSLIVGARNLRAENMPGENSFANNFSNFWFKLQTGTAMPDTQSGFRLYPLKTVSSLHTISGRYEFELEIMVRCAWKGVPIRSIPISVRYDAETKKNSHFRPFADFARISLLNTFLTLAAFLFIYPKKLVYKLLPNKRRG